MNEELEQYRVEPDFFWQTLLMMGGDGYDAIEKAEKWKWHVVSSWGSKGWDLGSWPLVIVFVRNTKDTVSDTLAYQVIEYVEGDVTMYSCPESYIRNEIIDELAFFHWKHQGESWVEGYDSVEQLPDELRGAYRS